MNDNFLICKKCNSNNPLFLLNCESCNNLLRNRIPNIDLWNIIRRLIDEPVNAFQTIIQADKKNFSFLFVFFFAIKMYFLSIIVQSLLGIQKEMNFLAIFIYILIVFVIWFIISFIIKYSLLKKVKTRIKDSFAVISFSALPMVISLFILTLLEFAVYGESLFSGNPSPFIAKQTIAYLFSILEVFLILWWSILLFLGINTSISNKLLSLAITLVVILSLLLNIFYNFNKNCYGI